MRITEFKSSHAEEARLLAAANYQEERERVPALPQIDMLPDLRRFADNGLGTAAFDAGRMVGFLCCGRPWEHAFNSRAAGVFSPAHAHGAVKEDRGRIYHRLYQAAAEKWVARGITYHAAALYAHDTEAKEAFAADGFGRRCVDAVRQMTPIPCKLCEGITAEELPKEKAAEVRTLRRLLSEHMGNSPCFMVTAPDAFEAWLADRERRDIRLFVARDREKPVAYMEVAERGESFASESDAMRSICGAFCLPEYRGRNIVQSLLNYAINKLKAEGYQALGVDYESFNPAANAFWPKYFAPYTRSVVRRIDECALPAETACAGREG